MRRLTVIITIIVILFSFQSVGHAAPHVSAANSILMEEITGRVLFEKDAYEQKPVASITKVMTAIIAIEQGKLKDQIKASHRAVYSEGSSIYLEIGEKMSLEDLLYGLMLRSGNDAAVAIAEHIGGSVEGFVFLMNEKAKTIGMSGTHFINPHGLHDENHYSTAFDMALLLRYAMQNKTFQKISQTSFHKPKSRTYGWKNKNRLVNGMYKYSTGGKTGFTKKSGRTLLSSAKMKGLSLIAVTLNGPDDWNDHIQLYNWGFKQFRLEKLLNKGKVTYPIKEIDDFLVGYIDQDVFYPIRKQEIKQLKKYSYLIHDKKDDNSIIGKTIFTLNDTPIVQANIHQLKPTEKMNRQQWYDNIMKISGLY